MSLDVLFTEAAKAGGPPRFTEDDIARRVRDRHRRRRRLATGAAVLIVVASAGLGLYLAGASDDASPVVGPVEIPTVPIAGESVIGQWHLVPGPDAEPDSVPPTVDLLENGRYRVQGCLELAGGWTITAGRLGLGPSEYLTLNGCGSEVNGLLTAFPTGATTLYADGLLRFATAGHTVDFIRADDDSPPDPTTGRADPFRTAPANAETVTGRWIPLGADVLESADAFLVLDGSGSASFEHCNAGTATWSISDGRIAFGNIAESTERLCVTPDDGSMYLEQILAYGANLTSDNLLVVPGPAGGFFLQREGASEPTSDPTGDADLTGQRWIRDVGADPTTGSASWIEFADNGTFTMTVTCGLGHGTWTRAGDEVAVSVTDPGDGNITNCPEPVPGVDSLGPIVRIRVGEELVIEHEPVASLGGGTDVSPEQVFRSLDSLPEATADDLVGEWSSAFTGSSGSTRTLLTFHSDGLLTPGDCPSLAWHVADGVLLFDGSEDPCLVDYGFEPPVDPLDVRIDGDVLYLSGPTTVALLVRGDRHMNDTSISVNGPGPSLRDAYADMGVEACCQENGDGLVRRGFVWEGHEVGVEALLLADAPDELTVDEATVELGGQVVSGRSERGTELAFDCGGYRFGVYAWADPVPDDALLRAASALLAALPCRASAPT